MHPKLTTHFVCLVPRPLSVFHLGQSVSDHVADRLGYVTEKN